MASDGVHTAQFASAELEGSIRASKMFSADTCASQISTARQILSCFLLCAHRSATVVGRQRLTGRWNRFASGGQDLVTNWVHTYAGSNEERVVQ